jgi:hypothetical protein
MDFSGILIYIIIILAIREIRCWYWKINKIVSLLESIDSKIGGLNSDEEQIRSVNVRNEFRKYVNADIGTEGDVDKGALQKYLSHRKHNNK